MKKVFALVLALTMLCCSAAFAADTDIAILVPNADHGWTGAVMTYAEEKAAAVNAEGTYTAQVITSADPANQITQVEDIIENQSANTVVILPQGQHPRGDDAPPGRFRHPLRDVRPRHRLRERAGRGLRQGR